VPVVKIHCFAAGEAWEIPVKVLRQVYWRKAGPDLRLLLVVIKPLGYRLRKGCKLLYRQPAFLICAGPDLDLPTLLQAYLDRWEIECNHRDEKSQIGVAQGQVWNPQAVARLPQFQVAIYSLLLLASILAYGFQRTVAYLPLPLGRRKSLRPSILDLLNLLRDQIFARFLQDPPTPSIDDFAALAPVHANATKPPLASERFALRRLNHVGPGTARWDMANLQAQACLPVLHLLDAIGRDVVDSCRLPKGRRECSTTSRMSCMARSP